VEADDVPHVVREPEERAEQWDRDDLLTRRDAHRGHHGDRLAEHGQTEKHQDGQRVLIDRGEQLLGVVHQ
jgi:hypothetical protein